MNRIRLKIIHRIVIPHITDPIIIELLGIGPMPYRKSQPVNETGKDLVKTMMNIQDLIMKNLLIDQRSIKLIIFFIEANKIDYAYEIMLTQKN